MDTTTFSIDGVDKIFSVMGSPEFKYGQNEILSNEKNDITYSQSWYHKGFAEIDFLSTSEYESLKQGLTRNISEIVKQECDINVTGFELENYHKYVKDNESHFRIVRRTRDLYPEDFSFHVQEYFPRFEKELGFGLSDINPRTRKKLHIIVRINRPQSNDYNPPHKDIYEGVDREFFIPQFVNFWIPIAGVTDKSNLPLASGSHFINEDKVLRTFEGGRIEGNKYRVRMIKSWNGESKLQRSTVQYGQVLIFTSHLIHGLAVNDNLDQTRVALEFRLFKS